LPTQSITADVAVILEPLSIRLSLAPVSLILYLTAEPSPWSIQHVTWFSSQTFTTAQLKLMTILRIWRRAKQLSVPAEVFDILISNFVSFHMMLPLALRVVLEKLAGGCVLPGMQQLNLETWQSLLIAVSPSQYLSTNTRKELLTASGEALFLVSQGELSALFV
jgi:hypothetical protein